jgi:lipoprotein-anchoring transpeptidase ErfK/SrfK
MAPMASKAAKPTEQELLVMKKKKAEAARKASAKKVVAKKAAARKVVIKKKPVTRARLVARERPPQERQCGSFLKCLFGSKPRPGVLRASTGITGGGDDYETADVVNWNGGGKYAPGSIVVRTPERALYLVMGDGKARRYKVGVGREGFQWSGNSRISGKAEWPTWRPPQVMIEREAAKGHYLPEVMEGGPENPLGARALYLGGTLFRIHGTNNASSIGGAVSSGCIRMMNTDVVDLYDRVQIGARVYVYQ